MAQPDVMTLQALHQSFIGSGLRAQLGQALFEPENWHQSLSGSFGDVPAHRRALVRAGDRVTAKSFVMALDRLGFSGSSAKGSLRWAFSASRRPPGLTRLIQVLQAALRVEGIQDVARPAAHVTVSYHAPVAVPTLVIEPVQWMIESFRLVRGVGSGGRFRYEVLAEWPLAPADQDPPQLLSQIPLF